MKMRSRNMKTVIKRVGLKIVGMEWVLQQIRPKMLNPIMNFGLYYITNPSHHVSPTHSVTVTLRK